MPANDNRFETYRTEGRFTLTSHAKERMATRGLRADAIDAATSHAASICGDPPRRGPGEGEANGRRMVEGPVIAMA